jgi:hypothetical protein
VYDHSAGCHVTGASNGSLYHYGNGAHVGINVNGSQFQGYDYDAGNHYSGQVNGNAVTMYDHGEGVHFQYSM